MRTKTYHTKDYYTRIKNDDSILGGGNEYVTGVIMGIMESVCVECVDDDFLTKLSQRTVRILKDKRSGDYIYKIKTTDELYAKFAAIVERQYPRLCEFDIYD